MRPKTETKTVQQSEEAKKPYMVFSSGPVRATVWENETEKDGKLIKYLTVTVVKNYYVETEKVWKHTSSFSKRDIASLKAVTDQLFRFLYLNETEDESGTY